MAWRGWCDLLFSETCTLRRERSPTDRSDPMAKLFHILAASVGSGLVLGASIRLGEALGSRIQAEMAHPGVNGDRPIEPPPAARKPAGDPVSPPFLSRLDRLEAKLSQSRPRQARPSVADAGSGSEWQS